MTKSYRAEQDAHFVGWECGTDVEMKMVVTFNVTDPAPATLAGPAEPSMIEDVKIRIFRGIDEVTIPGWLIAKFTDNSAFDGWLLSEAADQDEAARGDAADAARDERRMAR